MLGGDSDNTGVYVDKDFQGDMIFSCFVLKEKSDGFSKLFGSWNRRFLFLNMSQKVLYYSASPNSESHSEISLRNVINLAVFAHKVDEKTAIVNTLSRQYKFKFETMSEFRDFMIYFIYVKKLSTHQPLFEPPECFLELIRQSQKVVEQHKKFIQEAKGSEMPAISQNSTKQNNTNITASQTPAIQILATPPAFNAEIAVPVPDSVLRSTEATEEEARREERRRRQAEAGTDDEADETMIKEKKRKIVKKTVNEEQIEEDKKLIVSPKKHIRNSSETTKQEEGSAGIKSKAENHSKQCEDISREAVGQSGLEEAQPRWVSGEGLYSGECVMYVWRAGECVMYVWRAGECVMYVWREGECVMYVWRAGEWEW